jgi:hypothetical protein
LQTPGRYDAVALGPSGMDFTYDVTGTPRTMRWNGTALSVPGEVQPATDNAEHCGDASFRWDVVYAATGTINTSDAREKTPLRPLSEAERRAIRRIVGKVGVYQWLDAVAAKGPDAASGGARLHVGVAAQDVAEAFAAEGLDPAHYGLFCADTLTESVEVEEVVRIRRPKMRKVERLDVELAGGSAVLRLVEVDEPEIQLVAVVDEAGEPVLRDGDPLMHPVEVTEEVDETLTRSVLRPVLDAKGEPVMRLGVRYDQLFAMALAAMA